jgi:hypothetical protein
MAITNHRQVRSGVGEVIVTEWSNAGLVIYIFNVSSHYLL